MILHGATFLVSLSIRRRAGLLSYVLLRGVPIASCLMPGCFCCERPSLYPLLYRGSCGTCCTIISQCLSTEFECCLLIKLVSYDNAAELALTHLPYLLHYNVGQLPWGGIDRRSSSKFGDRNRRTALPKWAILDYLNACGQHSTNRSSVQDWRH